MGGLFYVPIFHFAGLNPVPYQVVLLLLLAVNVYLIYRFARLLGCGELAAGLAALVACYHGGLPNLYYNAAFIYDILCCFFYLCCLVLYIRIRNSGRLLTFGQTALFLVLFLCCLNSKEMAVTLPPVLLVYEWVYHRPAGRKPGVLLAWLRGPGRVIVAAGVLDALDVYGKLFGPDALANAEAYHPVYTLRRVYDFQKMHLDNLLLRWHYGWGGILALWAVLAYLAWRRAGRPALRFLWWFLILTPLPIEFLVGKSQACLYVPMVGWAIFAAVVLVDLAAALARVCERHPLFQRSGPSRMMAAILACTVIGWVAENRYLKHWNAEPGMARQGEDSWDIIQQLRAFHPRIPPRKPCGDS